MVNHFYMTEKTLKFDRMYVLYTDLFSPSLMINGSTPSGVPSHVVVAKDPVC